MRLGYKLSVLGIVIVLLALSAYVVLGVDSGATEEYDPSVMQGIFLERDGAADNFKEGIWVILDTGLYVWLDYLEDETYSQNPDTLGEFIHWDSINGAEILNYNLGYERDYRSSGIMKIRYQFDPDFILYVEVFATAPPNPEIARQFDPDFILYVEVFATAPPNPEIARFVSENIIGLSNDQSGFNIPVPPSSSQPSQPSQVSATATSTFTELTCEDTQQCSEIDQIWNLISPYVNTHQGEVYKPESATNGQWVPFTTLYPVPVGSSGGQTSVADGQTQIGLIPSNWGGSCEAVISTEISDIRGQPSISEKTINKILSTAGSPAAGSGNYFIQYGKEYGIDPAFALAFFRHESGYGKKGVAATTKGIGNIVYTPTALPDYKHTTNGDWSAYNSWDTSIKGWYHYMTNSGHYLKNNKFTIEEIIPIYAPSIENNVNEYLSSLRRSVQEYREIQESECGDASTISLLVSGNKILHIGASHTVGPYGKKMDELLRGTDAAVRTYAMGGSGPIHWVNGVTHSDFDIDDQGRAKGRYKNEVGDEVPLVRTVPTFSVIKQEFNPQTVIVSLGTNIVTYADNNKITDDSLALAKLASSGSTCYWVGPAKIDPKNPTSTSLNSKLNLAIQKIKSTVSPYCTFIDSFPLSSDLSTNSDGVHFDDINGGTLGTRVFNEISSTLAIS